MDTELDNDQSQVSNLTLSLFLSCSSTAADNSRPGSRLSASSRPSSRSSSRPVSSLSSADAVRSSRPASTLSSRSKPRSRPGSGKSIAWEENEAAPAHVDVEEEVEDEDEEGHHMEEDLGPLVIKGEDDIPKVCHIELTII